MHVQGKLNEEFLLFWHSTKAHWIFWYGGVIQLVIVLFNKGFFLWQRHLIANYREVIQLGVKLPTNHRTD